MEIQSLSISVPSGCPNNCKFCVSKMHPEKNIINQIEKNKRFRDLYKNDFKTRLAFARDNGCNTLMYTGNGEPMANCNYIEMVAEMNKALSMPFRMIEIQTSGVYINDENLRWLRNDIQVNTISLSLSSIFSNEVNQKYNGTPDKFKYNMDEVCAEIKKYDFNLRLSLNMTDEYDKKSCNDIFKRAEELGANQIIFRKLYVSNNNLPQDQWIYDHAVSEVYWDYLNNYIEQNGRKLERLPFGAMRYSINGISTVIDDDCMNTKTKEEMKYLILRENCKLYTKWDDSGSLLF
jgi:adenine C2-methylase RlmN of 23S rRNA A2503 and tRNA A37